MTPQGVGYPSSLPGLGQASAARALPVLVVGAAMNGDVIPAVGNYRRFTAACAGPLWEVELAGAGHLQFLDKQVSGLLGRWVLGAGCWCRCWSEGAACTGCWRLLLPRS
jgi:hypothetical protein